jgi:hypothetical protein
MKSFCLGGVLLILASVLTRGETSDGSTVHNLVFIGDSITAGAGLRDAATQAPPVIAARDLQQIVGARGTVYFSNQGHSGYTTVNFLPGGAALAQVEAAARKLQADHPGQLVVSLMLGTNDSANSGPAGAPVSAEAYARNLHAICFQLLADFSDAKIVLHHPIWYSPNTHNRADYLGSSASDRLKSYSGAIDTVIADCESSHTNHVFLGDTAAFDYFSIHFQAEMRGENGTLGVFWLHPAPLGAESLGRFWAAAIARAIGL